MEKIISVPWLPFGLDGLALKWFIVLRWGHEKSQDLIAHERVHLRQQAQIGFIRYCWKYLKDRDFRYRVEYEAYRFGSKLDIDDAIEMAKGYTKW
jgi:hypothetical protein